MDQAASLLLMTWVTLLSGPAGIILVLQRLGIVGVGLGRLVLVPIALFRLTIILLFGPLLLLRAQISSV